MKWLFALSILLLASCGTEYRYNEFGNLSNDVRKECAMAVLLPERNLTPAEVEQFWTQDRVELAACRAKHKELVTVIDERTKK